MSDAHVDATDRGEGVEPPIEDAAWAVLHPALTGISSPFLPGVHTWTVENARELSKHIRTEVPEAEPDENGDIDTSFIGRLGRQLEGAPDSLIVYAAELLYIQVLPLGHGTVGPAAKLRRIDTVLSWTASGVRLEGTLRDALSAEGAFGGGSSFGTRLKDHVLWLTRFTRTWWSAQETTREHALADPWTFRDLAASVDGSNENTIRRSLMYLVWPGTFESIVSEGDLRKIRNSFAHEIGGSTADLERDIWQLRQQLQSQGGERLHWYKQPYVDHWNKQGVVAGRRAWLVRGEVDKVEEWLTSGIVPLLPQALQVDASAASESSVRAAVQRTYANLDYAQRLPLEQSAIDFLVRMAVDDVILARAKAGYVLGSVESDAEAGLAPEGHVGRKVVWGSETIQRASLPAKIGALFERSGDVVELTNEQEALVRVFTPDSAATILTEQGDGALETKDISFPAVALELIGALHMDEGTLAEYLDVLSERRQMVFYGPPGTGKTYVAEALGRHIVGDDTDHLRTVQFHPSYAYEDFFEGIRPALDGGDATFTLVPGPLRKLVAAATTPGNEHKPYVLVIDEMNRANLAKVFGELYYLLEYRDQSINLQYSPDSDFRLPKNLFIIGTMNTLDRSISAVDAAIRRRFPFIELHPNVEPVSGVLARYLSARGEENSRKELLDALNAGIPERDLQIGPSYLMKRGAETDSGLERIWKYDILPLLDDHFYGEKTHDLVREQFGLTVLKEKLKGKASDDASLPLGSSSLPQSDDGPTSRATQE